MRGVVAGAGAGAGVATGAGAGADVLPPPVAASDLGLAEWIEERLLPLRGQPPATQADTLAAWWRELDAPGRFLLTKLIGGGFRVGVSKLLVQRALAEAFGVDPKRIAQGLMGYTDAKTLPSAARFTALHSGNSDGAAGQPYPFFLAHALDVALDEMPDDPLPPEVLSRDPAVCEAYAADPLVWHGPFKRPTVVAMAAMIAAIDADASVGALPLMWVHGEEDQLVPMEGTRVGIEKLRGDSFRQHTYPGARHEVFNETNSDEVLADVTAFVDAVLDGDDI